MTYSNTSQNKNRLPSTVSLLPTHSILSSMRPRRSVWSHPHRLGTLSSHRLCTFMSHAVTSHQSQSQRWPTRSLLSRERTRKLVQIFEKKKKVPARDVFERIAILFGIFPITLKRSLQSLFLHLKELSGQRYWVCPKEQIHVFNIGLTHLWKRKRKNWIKT